MGALYATTKTPALDPLAPLVDDSSTGSAGEDGHAAKFILSPKRAVEEEHKKWQAIWLRHAKIASVPWRSTIGCPLQAGEYEPLPLSGADLKAAALTFSEKGDYQSLHPRTIAWISLVH